MDYESQSCGLHPYTRPSTEEEASADRGGERSASAGPLELPSSRPASADKSLTCWIVVCSTIYWTWFIPKRPNTLRGSCAHTAQTKSRQSRSAPGLESRQRCPPLSHRFPLPLPTSLPPPCFAPCSRQLAAVTLHLSRTPPPPKKKKREGGREGAEQREEFRLMLKDRERRERN